MRVVYCIIIETQPESDHVTQISTQCRGPWGGWAEPARRADGLGLFFLAWSAKGG